MRFACILSTWLLAFAVRADDVQARALFRDGVDAMAAGNWLEAALKLEASLQHKDKPACRYNLVVTNRELHRPLEVARHAVVFLNSSDGRSHQEEATEVRMHLNDALRELATLQVDDLPLGVHVRIDSAPPRVMDGSHIYEVPGMHRLELWLARRQLESIDVELWPGAVQAWPRVRSPNEPAAAEEPERSMPGSAALPSAPTAVPRLRASVDEHEARPPPSSVPAKRKAAFALGIAGALAGLAAVGAYGYVASRTEHLRDSEVGAAGYTTTANRYERTKASVMPLAFVSGGLMASATAFVTRAPRRALGVSIATLLLGIAATSCGAALLARTPRTLVEGTEITAPTRQAGSLCIGAALPLLTYGLRLQWDLWGHRGGLR